MWTYFLQPENPGVGFWIADTLSIILAFMIVLLISLAFLLLVDRKVWAGVQMRKGPNVVGAFGLLQSFADFLKFVFKEIVVPAGADRTLFLLAPLITDVPVFLAVWSRVSILLTNAAASAIST